MNKQHALVSRPASGRTGRRGAFVGAAGLGLALISIVAGCGGGSTGPDSPGGDTATGGRAVIRIAWPSLTPARHIPYTADQVRVSVYDSETDECLFGDAASCKAESFKINRPGANTDVPISDFGPLPVRRPIRFEFAAYGSKAGVVDPSVPVATGIENHTFSGPGKEPIEVVLDATVAKLRVYDGPTLLADGDSVTDSTLFFPSGDKVAASAHTLTVEALDSENRTVLLARDGTTANYQVQWTLPVEPITVDEADVARKVIGTRIVVRRRSRFEKASVGAAAVTYDGSPYGSGKPVTAAFKIAVGQETRALLEPTTLVGKIGSADSTIDLTSDAAGPLVMVKGARTDFFRSDGLVYFYSPTTLSRLTRLGSPVNPISPNFVASTSTGTTASSFRVNGASTGTFLTSVDPATTLTKDTVDIDAPANASADESGFFYGLSGVVVTGYPKNAAIDIPLKGVDPNSGVSLTYLAVVNKALVYGASSTAVYSNAVSNKIDSSSITVDASNPSGESLGTITDIAAEGSYLYVLAKKDGGVGRVHVFDSALNWLYSVKSLDESRLANAVAISAVPVAGGGARVYVAYKVITSDNLNEVRVLSFDRPVVD